MVGASEERWEQAGRQSWSLKIDAGRLFFIFRWLPKNVRHAPSFHAVACEVKRRAALLKRCSSTLQLKYLLGRLDDHDGVCQQLMESSKAKYRLFFSSSSQICSAVQRSWKLCDCSCSPQDPDLSESFGMDYRWCKSIQLTALFMFYAICIIYREKERGEFGGLDNG